MTCPPLLGCHQVAAYPEAGPVFLELDLAFEPAVKPIRLVEPNAAEKRLIENLARIAHDGHRWEALVLHRRQALAGVDAGAFSEAGRRQLRYHMLLARLVGSNEEIGGLAVPEDPSAFPPGCANEVRLLRYEVELARGDAPAAERTRARILSERPHAAGLLDRIRDRGGFVDHYRKAARRAGDRPRGRKRIRSAC